VSATVSATRELFGNPGWAGSSWVAEHGLLMAVVWPVPILAIFLPLTCGAIGALTADGTL
jgi:ABC-2 type transport system permease protein